MIYHVAIQGQDVEVTLGSNGRATVDGMSIQVDLREEDTDQTRNLILDGRSYTIPARRKGRGVWEVEIDGRPVVVGVMTAREKAIAELVPVEEDRSGAGRVTAPMPGLVVRVEVEVGDRVDEGSGLVIVEAMKMENELTATGPGHVRAVHVLSGATVARDQLLVEIEPLEEEEG
jgi:biotin carboxyl carrier protein